MSKNPNLSENRLINKNILISIFKRMKRNPLKVFVLSDVFSNPSFEKRRYFNVLISLGIIELVPAVYNCGKNKRTRREVKGYRLKKEEK